MLGLGAISGTAGNGTALTTAPAHASLPNASKCTSCIFDQNYLYMYCFLLSIGGNSFEAVKLSVSWCLHLQITVLRQAGMTLHRFTRPRFLVCPCLALSCLALRISFSGGR